MGEEVWGFSPAAKMRRTGERGEGVVGGRSEFCRHHAVSSAGDVGEMEGTGESGESAKPVASTRGQVLQLE